MGWLVYRSFPRDAARPDALSRLSLGRDQTTNTRLIPHKKLSSRADFSSAKEQIRAVPVKEQVDSEKLPVLARLPTSVWPPTVLGPAAPQRLELPDELSLP